MKSFLTTTKTFLRSLINENNSSSNCHHKGIINIIIGNQASDADSMISSICYAYYKQSNSQNNGQGNNQNSNKDNQIKYIPLMFIQRNDIKFKREVNLLLSLINLSFDDLICFDELSFSEIETQHQLELTLMDHNHLYPTLDELYSTRVIEIIDHHLDQGFYSNIRGNSRIIAFNKETGRAEVGSTCTLVAEKFYSSNFITDEIALLLLGVIKLE